MIVPPQHPAELADALLTVLKDPELRRRMGNAGLARVRAHFTADRMVDETVAAYEAVAGKPRAADNGSRPPAD